jgi:pimeloyl-ACP methyl ester carboxylesterase
VGSARPPDAITRSALVTAAVRRCYVDGPFGQLHLRRARPARPTARPLLAFHLTPGSGRMYEPLLAHLGTDRLALAPDTPGYGASDAPATVPTIGDYARAMSVLLDSFGLDSVDLVGYHTGSKIAVCLALAEPARVHRLVLVSAPDYSPEQLRRQRDDLAEPVEPAEDGSHLLAHWRGLCAWRGPGQTLEMVQEEFAAQLQAGPRAHWGYRAAFDYPHARYLPQVTQRVLVLCPEDDLEEPTLATGGLISNGRLERLPGWGHGMTRVRAAEFARLLRGFLDDDRPGAGSE